MIAYCGGGGSAKTGVFNKICIQVNGAAPEMEISTDDQVCVGIYVYSNPMTNTTWLVGAVGNSVRRYSLPEGTLAGSADVGNGANAVATNAMANVLAVGCEDGSIHFFKISDDSNEFVPLGICTGHVKAVCAVSFCFAPHHVRIQCQGWNGAKCGIMKHSSVLPPSSVKFHFRQTSLPNEPQQILVRGCAFGDLEGNIIYTVASARRGPAYSYKWIS